MMAIVLKTHGIWRKSVLMFQQLEESTCFHVNVGLVKTKLMGKLQGFLQSAMIKLSRTNQV